jgi:hypothetical protein
LVGERGPFLALEGACAGKHCASFGPLGYGDGARAVVVVVLGFGYGVCEVFRGNASEREPAGNILIACMLVFRLRDGVNYCQLQIPPAN